MKTKHLDSIFEVKEISDQGSFQAYAAIFNNVDLDGDVIIPGAFAKTLADHRAKGTMPMLLWQHWWDEVCGKITDAVEDQNGLLITGEIYAQSKSRTRCL